VLNPIICTENLTFEYEPLQENGENITALRDIDLKIEKGSFTAVLGRNGSGKSTLAKNFNALYVPTSGRVLVAGMDTADDMLVWEIRKTAGMVFQNPDNQIVASVVEDDVAFGPENLGVPTDEIRQRIDDAMKSTGIYEQRLKTPSTLSGGQKQRVAIAGVIAMKPECIIFDEPTAMLDPKGRTDVMNIIAKLHKEGITIILITHFMEEACEADRIIIMNNGTVISDGKPAEIFSRPELIQEAGLEIPAAVRIAAALRKRGLEVPSDVLTNEALAEWLCSQKTSEEKKTAVKTAAKHTAEKSAPRISVEHLTYIYNKGRPDETLALDDVSFTIEPGGFTGIIGHTGSGKSTLIQHLNGLLKPDSGSVIPEPSGENRKKTGLVFQYPEYQLFEENVARDVAFGPKNLGLDEEETERRVKEAMELTGLPFDVYAERSPFELSGGQKRRAAIAGVIAMQPEVLILDEPTAGLDPQSHMEILDMIEKIRRERGCSIVLVSHNMDDVARLCTKVIVMDHGKLVLQGTPEEVFRQDRMLKNIGLGLPSGGELIYAVRQKGISPIGDALDETQAVDAISDYFGLSGR
jgi:energy-coupling factor transport system ATP-binding protein